MFSLRNILQIIVIKGFIVSGCSGPGADAGPATAGVPGSSRLSELLRDDSTDRFPKALETRAFRFPADHGAHEEYRNEWWYFTGNLDDADGRRFGYELTLFRFSLVPALEQMLDSAWQSSQVYIGHLAVTDVADRRFHVAQRYSRGAAGLAGAIQDPIGIWLDDWRIDLDAGTWRLSASDERFAIELALTALKPVVLNGNRGLSRKSAEPGNASYYYSVPRLDTEGELRIDGDRHAVSGLSWLDREWGSSALSPDQRGWDWFALQLTDGSELMVYQIRRDSGEADPFSSGTFTDADGNTLHLERGDFEIDVLNTWRSERGGVYPAEWQLHVAPLGASLRVRPVLPDQELITNVRYWEGAVDVSGVSAGNAVSGRGYVELTGYADP